jgi:hypothetical protein
MASEPRKKCTRGDTKVTRRKKIAKILSPETKAEIKKLEAKASELEEEADDIRHKVMDMLGTKEYTWDGGWSSITRCTGSDSESDATSVGSGDSSSSSSSDNDTDDDDGDELEEAVVEATQAVVDTPLPLSEGKKGVKMCLVCQDKCRYPYTVYFCPVKDVYTRLPRGRPRNTPMCTGCNLERDDLHITGYACADCL